MAILNVWLLKSLSKTVKRSRICVINRHKLWPGLVALFFRVTRFLHLLCKAHIRHLDAASYIWIFARTWLYKKSLSFLGRFIFTICTSRSNKNNNSGNKKKSFRIKMSTNARGAVKSISYWTISCVQLNANLTNVNGRVA